MATDLLVPQGGTGATTLTGIVKGNGASPFTAAVAGTDYQAPITLTTTGTSGAATFVSNTLNIPQYSGGGGAVSSVSNSDGTLTISPTTGAVVASIALGHANTWSGQQTFVAPIIGAATGTSLALGGATALDALDVNGAGYFSTYLGVNVPISTITSNTWTVGIQSPAGTQNVVSLLRPTNTVSSLLQFVPFGAFSSSNVAWFMGMFANSDSFSFGNYNGASSTTYFSISDVGVFNLPNLTASSAVATDASKNLISVTNTGTGNNVLATSPTITGATLTTTSVNGVTLTTGGGTTTFLNANGAYSTPAGGGTVTSISSPNNTLTIGSPTTTPTIDINLTHSNAWTASQTVSTSGTAFTSTGTTSGSTTGYGIIGNGGVGTSSDTGSAIGVQGNSTSAHTGAQNIGLYANAASSSSQNIGTFSNGSTFGSAPGYGIQATGSVNATGDTGNAIGIQGLSTNTHAGGTNYGGYFQASGGATNYGLWVQAGLTGINGSMLITSGGYFQSGVTTGNVFNIYDGSAHLLLNLGSIASSVNNLVIYNAATTTGPIISALGTDTNIDINITPKGTGQTKINSAALNILGNQTTAAWTTNGTQLAVAAATLSDNTSSGTVTTNAASAFGIPTFTTPTNAVTYTNGATLYIAGAPVAGTNVTVSNKYALFVAGGTSQFNGTVLGNGLFQSTTGSFTTIQTNGTMTNSNFVTQGGTIANTTATAQYQFAGSTTNFFRSVFYGSTSTTLTTGVNYSGVLVASAPITIFSSGTHPWLANMVVNPLGTIGGSGATVTNAATLFVGAAPSVATNNFTAYFDTGNVQINNGNIKLGTAGNKIQITTGSNASAGTGTLVGGTVTISTTAVTANSLIFLTDTSSSTTNVGNLTVSSKSAGTSFTVTSTIAIDTSTFNWLIIN